MLARGVASIYVSGGLAITNGYGLRSGLWIGAVLAVLALVSILPYIRHRQQGWS